MIEVRLLDDWRTSPPPATFLNIAGQQWTISLPDDAAAERLAETLAAQPNARLVGWSGTTLAVLMLLLPVGVFAVLGNGLYDLFMEVEPAPRQLAVLAGALLLYVVLAALAASSQRMSLLSQELGGMIDSFRDMTQRFHLRPARLMRLARAWGRHCGLPQAQEVAVWNPGRPDAGGVRAFWDVLLPLCVAQLPGGSCLYLHVRSDELHVIAGAVAGQPRLRLEGGDSVEVAATRGTTAGLAGERLTPLSILSAAERKLLTLAQIASFPLHALTSSPFEAAVGPLVFSENAFLKLARHFAERLEQDAIYRFLARCRNDYGYLVRNAERIEQLQLPPDTALHLHATQHLARHSRQLLISNSRRLLHDADPLATLCTINQLAVLHDTSAVDPQLQFALRRQLWQLISEALHQLETGEHYPLFAYIAQREFASDGPGMAGGAIARYLPRVIAEEDASSGAAQNLLALTRFNAFDDATLRCLARMLETVGLYAPAAAIWQKLFGLDPLLATVRLARLKERLGDAAGAYADIRHLLASSQLARRSELHIAALLEAAWLCYCAQPASGLGEGQHWLEQAGSELERSPGSAHEYWRLHNYRALYLDAAQRYAEAIAANRQALAIPGLQQKLYSGSLTNLAYVSRKQALSQLAQGAVAEAQSSLAEALEYAHLAVRLKRRIADVDELPVALHNLALIHLCRGWLGGESPQQAGEAAQAASAEGLAVLERIASSKKRFALCLENALALALLGQDSGALLREATAFASERREAEILAAAVQGDDASACLRDAVLGMALLA